MTADNHPPPGAADLRIEGNAVRGDAAAPVVPDHLGDVVAAPVHLIDEARQPVGGAVADVDDAVLDLVVGGDRAEAGRADEITADLRTDRGEAVLAEQSQILERALPKSGCAGRAHVDVGKV